ncbi:hypothetical protein HUK65_10865 [Rhodobacteraceae bacterium 2376]|uniref:Uncharacterized protein n=1 Tax=Rhabdonatronobacter sediminivivens TaxID=2743469 RepID=A0A7Z0L0V0_9RHOB|nr:dockerin type I domain-containing protein [Rhabdonatronobacter sediminivivens]NYS25493.1 hypothetical protein [Rhabdonatronobacter sediminivivens]
MSNARISISYQDLLTVGSEVSKNAFGGIYTSYRPFENYQNVSVELGTTLLRWPGGTLSEDREDRYGLEFHALQNPDIPRPDLIDLVETTNDNNQTLSVIIPTKRYLSDVDSAAAETAAFMDRLTNGDFGAIRNELILEIGNEFYAHFDDVEGYARISEAILSEIKRSKDENPEFYSANKITVAMQMARNHNEDALLREHLSDDAKSVIDYMRTHRLSVRFESSNHRIDGDQERFALWSQAIEDAGGNTPGLYVSAWNSASWTRNEALESFILEHEKHDVSAPDISPTDLAERTNLRFEDFWENGRITLDNGQTVYTTHGLANRDYGAAKESHILEIFTSYAYHGLDVAAIYGVDIIHPSAFGVVNDTGTSLLGGAGAFGLMSRYLPGLSVTQLHSENTRPSGHSEEINTWGYNSDDYAVLFFGANAFSNLTETLEVEVNLEFLPVSVWGKTIKHETPEDWREIFGVPNSVIGEQSEEAKLYSSPSIEPLEFSVKDGVLSFTFAQDFETAAFIFAHNESGAAQIGEKSTQEATKLSSSLNSPNAITINDSQRFFGDASDNLILVNGSWNEVGGGAGNDVIVVSGSQGNTIWGGEGDDVIIAVRGDNILNGGPGNDRIIGGTGNDVIYGGEGDDIISVVSGDNRIYGGSGANIIFGGTGDDEISVYVSDTSAEPGAEGSFIYGVAGKNTLTGGYGSDTIIGGSGNDLITSYGDSNAIFGNGGHNTAHLYGDRDQYFAGIGREHVFLHGASSEIYIESTSKVIRIENFSSDAGHSIFFETPDQAGFADNPQQFVQDHATVNQWGNVEITLKSGEQRVILPGFRDIDMLAEHIGFWTPSQRLDDLVGKYSEYLDTSSIFSVSAFEGDLISESEAPEDDSPATYDDIAGSGISEEPSDTPEAVVRPELTVKIHGARIDDLSLKNAAGEVSVVGTKSSKNEFKFNMQEHQDIDDLLSLTFSTSSVARPTAADALDILRLAVGLPARFGDSSALELIAADVNGDGRVSASDALMALRMATGILEPDPIQVYHLLSNDDGFHRVDSDHGLNVADVPHNWELDLYGVGLGSLGTIPVLEVF